MRWLPARWVESVSLCAIPLLALRLRGGMSAKHRVQLMSHQLNTRNHQVVCCFSYYLSTSPVRCCGSACLLWVVRGVFWRRSSYQLTDNWYLASEIHFHSPDLNFPERARFSRTSWSHTKITDKSSRCEHDAKGQGTACDTAPQRHAQRRTPTNKKRSAQSSQWKASWRH